MNIKIGDMVMCTVSGIIGVVIEQFYPRDRAQQTIIRCHDGKKYFAPTSNFIKA